MVISAKARTLLVIISKQLGCQACIDGEKHLDSMQPSNRIGNGLATRASVLFKSHRKGGQ